MVENIQTHYKNIKEYTLKHIKNTKKVKTLQINEKTNQNKKRKIKTIKIINHKND